MSLARNWPTAKTEHKEPATRPINVSSDKDDLQQSIQSLESAQRKTKGIVWMMRTFLFAVLGVSLYWLVKNLITERSDFDESQSLAWADQNRANTQQAEQTALINNQSKALHQYNADQIDLYTSRLDSLYGNSTTLTNNVTVRFDDIDSLYGYELYYGWDPMADKLSHYTLTTNLTCPSLLSTQGILAAANTACNQTLMLATKSKEKTCALNSLFREGHGSVRCYTSVTCQSPFVIGKFPSDSRCNPANTHPESAPVITTMTWDLAEFWNDFQQNCCPTLQANFNNTRDILSQLQQLNNFDYAKALQNFTAGLPVIQPGMSNPSASKLDGFIVGTTLLSFIAFLEMISMARDAYKKTTPHFLFITIDGLTKLLLKEKDWQQITKVAERNHIAIHGPHNKAKKPETLLQDFRETYNNRYNRNSRHTPQMFANHRNADIFYDEENVEQNRVHQQI